MGKFFLGSYFYAHKVFILQKKIIGIITNSRPRNSCREVFKIMEIMTLLQPANILAIHGHMNVKKRSPLPVNSKYTRHNLISLHYGSKSHQTAR